MKPETSPTRIRDIAPKERPRERLRRMGAAALSNAELLAILLRTGTQGASVLEVASRLLQEFDGKLTRLQESSVEELCKIRGIGQDKALTLVAAFELVRRARQEQILDRLVFETPEQIAELMREHFAGETRERLRIIHLNKRREIIRIEDAADGFMDEITVANNILFRQAILNKASELVLVHNHPSGNPMPSTMDIETTRDLVRCGHLLGIPILDHIIIGKPSSKREKDFVSLRNLGYIRD